MVQETSPTTILLLQYYLLVLDHLTVQETSPTNTPDRPNNLLVLETFLDQETSPTNTPDHPNNSRVLETFLDQEILYDLECSVNSLLDQDPPHILDPFLIIEVQMLVKTSLAQETIVASDKPSDLVWSY